MTTYHQDSSWIVALSILIGRPAYQSTGWDSTAWLETQDEASECQRFAAAQEQEVQSRADLDQTSARPELNGALSLKTSAFLLIVHLVK